MKLLVDENLSPRLVVRLHAKGVEDAHIVHIGRSGMTDPDLWRLAFERSEVVVTTNVGDFIVLARGCELHAGIIAFRVAGLSAEEQWRHLEPVVNHVLQQGRDLTNKLVEVWGVGDFTVDDLPAP
jgi:predicted nuclease of predicted toxin-antitoxin system